MAILHGRKKAPLISQRGFPVLNPAAPTLPHSHPCSTIGAKELNFRVRDGNGCDLLAIATEISFCLSRIHWLTLLASSSASSTYVTIRLRSLFLAASLSCEYKKTL